MEEQQTLPPTGKIYPEKMIWRATILGGPLVAGYLIAENYKTFDAPEKATKTWIIAVLVTVAIFAAVFAIPDSVKIPNMVFPFIEAFIASIIVQKFQRADIANHENTGGPAHGGWRVFAVGIIGCAVTLLAALAIIMLSFTVTDSTATKTYGKLHHELVYEPGNITAPEVDKLAAALTNAVFFDNAQQKSVFARKENTKYVIVIPVTNNTWNDQELVGYFEQFRQETQRFLGQPLIIDLCSDTDLEDVKLRIE
jgi:uncharacterized membrane protein YbaN (DUF454 family)